MAQTMIDNQHNDPIISVVASVFFALWSILMNFAEVDSAIIQPILHLFQIIAAIAAIISFLCSISPAFKERVINYLKLH